MFCNNSNQSFHGVTFSIWGQMIFKIMSLGITLEYCPIPSYCTFLGFSFKPWFLPTLGMLDSLIPTSHSHFGVLITQIDAHHNNTLIHDQLPKCRSCTTQFLFNGLHCTSHFQMYALKIRQNKKQFSSHFEQDKQLKHNRFHKVQQTKMNGRLTYSFCKYYIGLRRHI